MGQRRKEEKEEETKIKKEKINNLLIEMLGDQGLQPLMDNFTTAIDTGISNIEAKPVIMFFDGHCLMVPEEEDCIIHTYLEAVDTYE